MSIDFKTYLEKKKAQKQIDSFSKKYNDKKVVLYGAGKMALELLKNYDFSKLNVVGIADLKFQDDDEGDFWNFKKIGSYDLLDNNFDVLLIINYDNEVVEEFIEDTLCNNKEVPFKVETLIKMNILDYIKKLIKEN